MSDIYSPDTPAMRRDRIIRANALSGRCTKCGTRSVRRDNLANYKDGSSLCPDCNAKFLAELFGEGAK